VKLGIVTPVLTLLPRAHAQWEESASFDDVVSIVREADRLGYHHCTCSEHVAVPVDIASVRGGRYYDPLATFGALAPRTEGIRFAAHVLVLGYHHPRYGTLDVVSGGRLILGVGVGSLREEFELLDALFEDRGARADDAMRALRAALSRTQPEYHGRYFDFEGFLVEPSAVQPRVPMWVGGRTRRSLRRAIELGDGWAPFGLRTSELRDMLRQVDVPLGFDVLLQSERPLDPVGEPERVRDELEHLASIGATGANVRFVHHSASHYREQLAALLAVAPPN